jgi:hypothetical protein
VLLRKQRRRKMDKALLTAPPALAAGTAALNRLAATPSSSSAATSLAAALIGDASGLKAAAGDVSAARDTLNFLLRAVSRNASITTKQLRGLLEAHSDLSGAAIEVVQAAVAMVGWLARLGVDSQHMACIDFSSPRPLRHTLPLPIVAEMFDSC